MAFANFAAYLSAIASPPQRIAYTKTVSMPNTSSGQGWLSSWLSSPNAGATPTTAATVDRTAAGALGQFNAATELRMFVDALSTQVNSLQGLNYGVMIADRLCHQGGLDGTLTSAQTTNLPTAAIPRYNAATDRICAGLEIYGALGVTLTTATVSYTNQSSTAGQTSAAIGIGASNNRSAVGCFLPISLAAGDTGVKSVESVTLAASTTSVGNFGVTLYKPLLMIPALAGVEDQWKFDPIVRLGALLPKIEAGACLWALIFQASGVSGVLTCTLNSMLNFFED